MTIQKLSEWFPFPVGGTQVDGKRWYPYNELSVKGLAVSEAASSQESFFCGRKLVRYQKFTFSKQNEDIAD